MNSSYSKISTAVILAAGMGVRLRNVTGLLPKGLLEIEGKSHGTVSVYSCIAKNYLKYRRVKFDKDELETSLDYKKERQSEKYPLTKEDIKILLDHASFIGKAKILLSY